MSRVVKLANGRKVMMIDDEAEAWELANKIIYDLRNKYNLHEPPGVDDLRMWMDEMSLRRTHPPVTAVKAATETAILKSPHTMSTIEVPYIGTGRSFSHTEALAYIPAGATLHGVYDDTRKLKFIITYSV